VELTPPGAVEAAAVVHLSSIVLVLAGLAIVARLLDTRARPVRTGTANA
jgi:hypothetical protein